MGWFGSGAVAILREIVLFYGVGLRFGPRGAPLVRQVAPRRPGVSSSSRKNVLDRGSRAVETRRPGERGRRPQPRQENPSFWRPPVSAPSDRQYRGAVLASGSISAPHRSTCAESRLRRGGPGALAALLHGRAVRPEDHRHEKPRKPCRCPRMRRWPSGTRIRKHQRAMAPTRPTTIPSANISDDHIDSPSVVDDAREGKWPKLGTPKSLGGQAQTRSHARV